MLVALGTVVIVMSFYGMANGDKWAEYGWGEDNVLAHDEAYEEMWALHLMPLGVMAIITGMVVRVRNWQEWPCSPPSCWAISLQA